MCCCCCCCCLWSLDEGEEEEEKRKRRLIALKAWHLFGATCLWAWGEGCIEFMCMNIHNVCECVYEGVVLENYVYFEFEEKCAASTS